MELYDLTNPQKSIWLTEQFYKGSTINNLCGTVSISEVIDFTKLNEAINILVRDNDALRIHLKQLEDGTIKQFFTEFSFKEYPLYDLSSSSDLKELESKLVAQKYQVLEGDLNNIVLFRFPDSTGGLIIGLSHLVGDACTASLLASKVTTIYNSLKTGSDNTETPASYADYILSEEQYLLSQKFEKDKQYWEETFTSVPDVGIIPSLKTPLNENCEANRMLFTFSKQTVDNINEFCRNNRISIFNFLIGIYALYIGRVSNLTNFTLGTPVLNRTTFVEKNTPGMFISTVPLQFNITENSSFVEFTQNIAKDTLSVFRHQKYPYQNILEHVRKTNPSQPNLYDILISYQNSKTNRNSSEIPYRVNWIFNNNVADSMQIHMFDMNDEGTLNIAYDYRISKYSDIDILNIHNRVSSMVSQVLSNPTISLCDIDIVTDEEKNRILNEFNDTYLEYDKSKTVIDYFEEQVAQNPDKTALVFKETTFTYKELNEKSNILANYLIKTGTTAGDIIGLLINRSPEMIIGLIAILKAGAAYLPIDPTYPEERISYIIDNSECKKLLVNDSTMLLAHANNIEHINISLNNSTIFDSEYSKENINLVINPESLVYMIYTSGSTGKPKGVMIKHINLNNFLVAEKNIIDFDKNKVMVSVTTMCFDIFALEIWGSLTSGMKLILASDEEQMSPSLLKRLCEKYSVNMIQTTPSRYLCLLSDETDLYSLDTLTDIMVGGEAFPKILLEKLQKYSTAKIFNMYGPTETTVWSTIKDLTKSDFITIGKPIANTKCYILDKNKKLLPPNVCGELYIGGDGVSAGYWRRADLTAEKFITSPYSKNDVIYNTNDLAYFTNDGEIVHLGRTDFQVKIRGYRIELQEIRNILLKFPNITDAVVTAHDNKFLVCYYTSSSKELVESDISAYLLKYLPNYMIPAHYIYLEKLPLTPNGKLDVKRLPKVENLKTPITLASTDTEKEISNALSEILNTSDLDINTTFFDFGLDSLGIINAQTLLLRYNLVLSTQDFYKYTTIHELAKKLDDTNSTKLEKKYQIPEQFMHSKEKLLLDFQKLNKSDDLLGNVLLTGANGFIGIHILHELIQNTNHKVFCLVREKENETSFERLRQAYMFYFGFDITNLKDRLYVLSGSITDKNFGYNIDDLESFSQNFSTIVHTAAKVSHYGKYDDFEDINIKGTKNIAEFAYRYHKRLIHISSISVSGNYLVRQDNRNVDFSENNLYIGQHYTDNVYVYSKFKSETIVLSYMEKGLTAQILRIGIVTGRFSDGVFQQKISHNAFYNRIKSLVMLGAVSANMLDNKIEFTPVDSCAKAIVTLAKNSICDNKVFNLYNQNLMRVESLVEVFRMSGFNIDILSKKEFNNLLHSIATTNSYSALDYIVNDFSVDADNQLSLNYNFSVNIKSEFTINYLHMLGFDWPVITDEYIYKIVNYMKKVGFIK